jgi:exopolysaccharide biosynthesis protein
VGLSEDRKTLLILVVDGRQPGYSQGLTLLEMAELMRSYGARNAINLDGGGSSTLVMEGPLGFPVVLNSPIHLYIPGLQRPVGNHLGIFARK